MTNKNDDLWLGPKELLNAPHFSLNAFKSIRSNPPTPKKPTKAPVITNADLSWLCESTVLTIINDRPLYERAQEVLRQRRFLPRLLCHKAIKDSGDELWSLYNSLNKHPHHRQVIRNRITILVNDQIDQVTLKHEISARDLDKVAEQYQPKCDFSKLEERVKMHLTATAFNEMSERAKISWLKSDMPEEKIIDVKIDIEPWKQPAPGETLSRVWPTKHRDFWKQAVLAGLYGADEATMRGYSRMFPDTMYSPRKHKHITDPVAPPGNFKILKSRSSEKPMNTSEKPRSLTEVFGVVITGKTKPHLMEMIRQAKLEVDAFADLDQDSAYVKSQVKTINDGIKKLYTELDK